MKYRPMELEIPTYSIYVNQPEGHPNIAVLDNMSPTEDLLDYLNPILDEVKKKGVEGVVVNLSLFPSEVRRSFIALFEGVFISAKLEGRYTGITEEEMEGGVDPSFTEHARPKVFDGLDAAVESFSEQ